MHICHSVRFLWIKVCKKYISQFKVCEYGLMSNSWHLDGRWIHRFLQLALSNKAVAHLPDTRIYTRITDDKPNLLSYWTNIHLTDERGGNGVPVTECAESVFEKEDTHVSEGTLTVKIYPFCFNALNEQPLVLICILVSVCKCLHPAQKT